MDANQPLHYPIHVYQDSPLTEDGRTVTLCPGARHLNRASYAIRPDQVTCRRCSELLSLVGLTPATKPPAPAPTPERESDSSQ
jgi:hypothetical protein